MKELIEASRGRLSLKQLRPIFLLAALYVLPVWLFSPLPTQDGPVHAYNAALLAELALQEPGLASGLYRVHWVAVPNWLSQTFIASVSFLSSPQFGEKLFLTIYIGLVPLGMTYAANSFVIGSGQSSADNNTRNFSTAPLLLVFPFLHGYTLHMGFYNFVFSLALFLFGIGHYLRCQSKQTWNIFGLGLISLATYFCHPVSLVTLLVAIFAIAAWQSYWDVRAPLGHVASSNKNYGRIAVVFARRTAPILVALIPALLLLAEYIISSQSAEPLLEQSGNRLNALERAGRLLSLSTLVSFSWWEFLFSLPLVIVFVLASLSLLKESIRERRLYPADVFLMLTVGFVTLCFIAPDELAGGSVLEPRLAIYPYFTLILWFLTRPISRFAERLVRTSGWIVAVGLLALHVYSYSAFASEIVEAESLAGELRAGDTLLGIGPPKKRGRLGGGTRIRRVDPIRHVDALLALRQRSVLLSNYQAAHSYFPVQFKPESNPYRRLGSFHLRPFEIDMSSLDYDDSIRIDYILLAGTSDNDHNLIEGTPLQFLLAERFVLAKVSSPRGIFRLYRNRSMR